MLKRILFLVSLCLVSFTSFAQNVTVAGALVGNGTYATLSDAFTAINGGAQTGAAITVTVLNNTTETSAPTLNAGTWTSLTVSPSGGAWTVSGSFAAPMIDLNGADNVTFDGLNSGGNALTIVNTNSGASSTTSTFRFIGDATNNVLTRCAIQGSPSMSATTNGGIIFFSAGAVTTGNDNNTISFCDIGPAGTNLPSKAIYGNGSTGSTAVFNSGNIITNNNIFDCFQAAAASNSIYLNSGNSGWIISNNRFYQTAARLQTTGALHTNITISGSTGVSNEGHLISGNIFGFANSAGTGTFTFNGVSGSRYVPINIAAVGGTAPNSIQGNTFSNIALSGNISGTGTTSIPFMAIFVNAGNANIGTVTGNIVGSTTAANSIVISSTSTSAGEVDLIYFFPSLSANIANNQIGGITVGNSSTAATTLICLRANTLSGFNNTITNNTVGFATAPIVNTLIAAGSGAGRTVGILSQLGTPIITGNTVAYLGSNTAPTGTGTTSGVIGISCETTSGSNANVSNNTVHTLANNHPSAAVNLVGLSYTGATTGTNLVARNNISTLALASSSASALISGISVSGGNTTYQNNMVRLGHDGTGAAVTAGVQVNGINELSGANNFYHNSVYVGGSGVGGTANSFAFSSAVTVSTRNYFNNIFFNARSNGAGTGKHYGIRVAGTAPNPAGLTSNNNVIFANGTGGFIGQFNAVDQASIAAWRTATGQDNNSLSADPGYANPTGNALLGDLHIGAGATPIESSGISVPTVTDDFDGQARAGLTPVDIGADAGNFLALDLSGPGIVYTPLLFTCSTGDRTLTATITDATGVPTTGPNMPRIYFRKNAGAWFSNAGTLAGGTATNGTWNFVISATTLGGLVASDVIQYYVIAQDISAGNYVSANPGAGLVATDVNTVTTPPTTPNSYTISPTLSGTYTVGATGTYPTLTAAVNAYNTSCLGGPVVFSLIDATYPGETFPITVLANVDASAVNTLTIKPATGVSPVITGSSAVAILRINGGDFITLDGSNTAGGTTRDLTVVNTNTGTSSAVIWVSSQSVSNGASNAVIKNCVLRGNASTTTFGGVIASNGTTIGTAAEADMPNLQIVNNAISTSFYGIALVGPTTFQTNAIVQGNNIGSAVIANKIGFQGIFSAQQSNALIADNTIFGVTVPSGPSAAGAINCAGIAIVGSQSGGSVVRNQIFDVRNQSTTGFGALGIALGSGSTGINMTIANNFISDIAGQGFNGLDINDNGFGLAITNGTGWNILHNTVLINTNQVAAAAVSAPLWIGASVPAAALNVRNNLFVNTQTAGGQRYAVIVRGATNTIFTNINYNDYFTTNGPNLLSFNSTNQANLAALQTALGGNANSVSILPVFTGAPDLHLPAATNTALDNRGTPVAVTTDIDNAVRSPFAPDMGADEFGAVGPEITVLGNNTVITDGDATPSLTDHTDFDSLQVCAGTLARTYTIRNSGNDTLRVSGVVVTGTGFSLTTAPALLNLAPLGTTTFVVTFDPSATGLSTGSVTVNSNDLDEAAYDYAIQGFGEADTTDPVAICQNITAQLDGSGNATITAAAINNGSTDFCGVTSLAVAPSAFTCANIGANTVTLTVGDAAGNTGTCTATVTVADTIDPVAACQSITVYLNGSGNVSVAASAVNNGSTDNCGAPTLSLSPNTFTCANTGSNSVTLTATDASGNSSTCATNITVLDSIDPVAVCQAVTVVLDGSGNATTTAASVNNGSTDNCAITGLSLSASTFTCGNLGSNTVTLTATDAAGNTGTCTATVTVTDTTDPVAVCQNISVFLNGGGSVNLIPAMVNNGSSDNCAITGFSLSSTSLTCANIGTNNVTLTATDASGNSATCTAVVTVADSTHPVAVCQSITAVLNASGNATITAASVNNGSSDNCGVPTLSVSPLSFTCANLGANTVTLTATDASGNSSTCTATVTVSDTTDPIALCQNITVALNGSGLASISPASIDNGSTDNCVISTYAVSASSFTCANLGVNTVTLTATDASGNSGICTATITVADTTDPVAVCQNVSVTLGAGGTATVTAASINSGSTDNCAVTTLSVSPSSFTCANLGTNTVTLTVGDASGNTSTCTATVTVTDLIAPVATCQPVTLHLSAAGTATLSAASVNNGSSDNCGLPTLSVSPSAFTCANVGTPATVTLTASDAGGNSATCTATVTVLDTVSPAAICQNVSATLGGGGTATITPAMVDNGSSDACGIATITLTPSVFACAEVGPNTVTLTVTDVNGNASTCTAIATINANDVVPPVAVCQNISVVLNASGSVAITGAALNNGSTDNCGIAFLTASPATLTCANVGTVNVDLIVTDGGGNSDTCTSVVTVSDTTDPVAVCQNPTIALNAAGVATLSAAQVNNGSSDACGIASATIPATSYTCANVGASNSVTLTVTDVNGNSSTCSATVTVVDTIDPVATCQAVSVNLNASGNASTTAAAVNNGSTDACGIASLALSQTAFTCANLGANTVTLTVTDVNGNSSTCTATVTVVDAIAPTAICQAVTVNLDASGNASTTAAAVNNGSTDNCAVTGLSLSTTAFTCANLGANTVTLTATDASGNSGTCTATVTVVDTLDPVAICQAVTVSLNASGTGSTTAAAVNNGSTDNCGVTGLALSTTAFTCANLGANTVTLTATDASGNSSTCTAVVTVVDAIAPTAICQSVTVNLNASGTASTTAAAVNNGSTDNCGITGLSLSTTAFTCANLGTNTVTLTATDASGNSGTCTATVTVVDAIAPTAICQAVTVSLNASGTASTTAAAVNNGSTDNCAVTGLALSTATFSCANLGANTVTLTATDASGNSGTCTATVTVVDAIAPTAICQAVTVNLNASGTASTTAAAVNNGSTDNCAITGLSLSTTTFTCANLGANAVTLTATDASGNSGTCTATVTVVDAIAPTPVCQAVTVSLDASGNASTTAAAINNGSSDNCAIASLSLSPTAFTCANLGANTVTLTVTDASGNSNTCAALVTVVDAIAPTAICQALTVNLDASGNASTTAAAVNNGSSDNCAITSLTLSPTAFTCANLGANTVTLTATDASGNSGTCTAIVTVVDAIAPTAICQSLTLYLDATGIASTTAAAVDNGSTDNCAVNGLVLSQTDFFCNQVGPNTVTLTVSDASGNTGTCVAIVTVLDTLAPVAVCQDIVLSLDNNGLASITDFDLDGGSTDNCAIDTLVASLLNFTCAEIGDNNVVLTVIDFDGNVDTCTAIVTIIDAVAPVITCQDTSIVLSSTGSTTLPISAMLASATDNCGVDSTSASQDTWSCGIATVTAVTITVTDASGNVSTCVSNVTTTSAPLVAALTPTVFSCGNNVSCNGATDGGITTAVSGGCEPYTYAWTGGATTQDLIGVGVGTYTVTVTDGAGNTTTRNVTLVGPAPLAAQIVATDTVCQGATNGNVDINVTGGNDCSAYQYLWSNGATTQDLTGVAAGTYTVTVTDVAGCSTTLSVTVGTYPTPTPSITQSGGLLTCTPAFASYQWNLGGAPILGATSASYVATITGFYSVSVVDGNGCAATSDTLGVIVTNLVDGMDRLLGLSLYPNPARGEFNLRTVNAITQGVQVTLTDMYGKAVKSFALSNLSEDAAFDIQDLAQGTYLVEVRTNKGQRSVLRLVVQ